MLLSLGCYLKAAKRLSLNLLKSTHICTDSMFTFSKNRFIELFSETKSDLW